MIHTNVDPNEIAKFSTLAAQWWDPQGPFRTLHDINPLRVQFMQQVLDQAGLDLQQPLLDVGCGGGLLSEALASLGAQVTAIDLDEAALSVAKAHQLERNLAIHYQYSTAEALAQTNPGAFQVIACMEMLEHVPDPQAIIAACSTLIAPGGYVFFSTLNRSLKSYCLAILGAEYLLKLLPKGTHDYMKFICPAELAHWARQAGLEVKLVVGIGYNPLTHKAFFEKKPDVNYLMACFKPS